jgi:hypothetical protein
VFYTIPYQHNQVAFLKSGQSLINVSSTYRTTMK